MTDTDPDTDGWWDAHACAAHRGVAVSTWRGDVSRGHAPPPRRRNPRTGVWEWSEDEVRGWRRPGRGHRTDLDHQRVHGVYLSPDACLAARLVATLDTSVRGVVDRGQLRELWWVVHPHPTRRRRMTRLSVALRALDAAGVVRRTPKEVHVRDRGLLLAAAAATEHRED